MPYPTFTTPGVITRSTIPHKQANPASTHARCLCQSSRNARTESAMRHLLLASLSLTGLFIASLPALAGTPLPDAPHIVVSGEGKVSAPPDSVRLSFEFESRASQPLPAKQSVDQGVNRLLARLTDFGIADSDIRASDLSASEDIDYTDSGRRVSNGFEASRSVSVLLKPVDRLNELIDAGLAAGAKGFSGLAFESTQATALRSEAKRKAIEKVRSQASETAAAFGASLGAVYSVDSVGSNTRFDYYGRTLDRITVTGNRAPGRYLAPTVEYSENVSAVFELKR